MSPKVAQEDTSPRLSPWGFLAVLRALAKTESDFGCQVPIEVGRLIRKLGRYKSRARCARSTTFADREVSEEPTGTYSRRVVERAQLPRLLSQKLFTTFDALSQQAVAREVR